MSKINEDNIVGLTVAGKMSGLKFYLEDCKAAWFKVGEEWRLLPTSLPNLIKYPRFLLAPTLEQARRWCRNELGIFPIISTYVYYDKGKVDKGELKYEIELRKMTRGGKVGFWWISGKQMIWHNRKIAIEKGILYSIEEYKLELLDGNKSNRKK